VSAVGSDATAVLRLDGDGLPGTYETNVTGTDPLDPDSDSSETDANETDDGVVDGREDYDDDGLPTLAERDRGTDPLAPDTDGDGLTDRTEIVLTQTSPLTADSDGDGTTDPREDPDGDGLDNAAEIAAGTDPQIPDTDRDGLTDREETETYETNATAPDTDQDGLLDGEEIELGTDPLVADTDDDGTLDGNETFTTVASNESANASVAVTGEGAVSEGVTIERSNDPLAVGGTFENATVVAPVDFESEREFDNATITFSYNDSAVPTNESDLAVFRFNESLQVYLPLNSTVDRANETVSTDTPHFSTYAVMSASEWREAFSTELPSRWSLVQAFTDDR